jgi:hypothetical protein
MVGALLRDIAVALARANGRACVELVTRLVSQRGAGRRRRQRQEGDRDQSPSSEDSGDDDSDADAAEDSKERSPPSAAPAAAANHRPVPPAAGAAERSAAREASSGQPPSLGRQVSMRSDPPLLHIRTAGAQRLDREAAEREAAAKARATHPPNAHSPAHGQAPNNAAPSAHGRSADRINADMGARGEQGGVMGMDAAVLPAYPLSRRGWEGPAAPFVAMRNAADNARQRRYESALRRRASLRDFHPPCVLGHPRLDVAQEQSRLARNYRITRARSDVARDDGLP